MPRFAQLFKDTSPPLVYSNGWQGGSSANDPLLDKYAQATYTFTKTPGATLNFRFNGTFVGIYGAKRPGYGAYSVKVDDHVFPTLNANSDVPLFNQTLFNTTLHDGLHNVTLTNLGNTTFDIDYLYFEGNSGKTNEPLLTATFQDNDPSFTYFPASSWRQSPRPGTFSGSTGTITNDPNASLQYKFKGDVILLYGTVTPTSVSSYLVSVDNGPFFPFSARKASVRPHQVLYYASNLGRGTHTLKLKFAGTNGTTGDFAVDFANLYSTPSLGAHEQNSFAAEIQSPPLSLAEASHDIPKSVIAGLTVTSSIAFLAIMAVIYLLWSQRRQKKEGKFVKF
ncbi:hypothetical protein JR316_0001839 [Psilocybe cubensis]|uniref:Uncharacterized protein n=2 Tax=Psilocybe cubensis TaxID=181762 RepID=A0A8H7Y6T5_PSICU|nr:hypothetical protein JR316_0001839 [Psilocybe cubensis]KAH9484935.1 hypothetical protein JR316_0001839 [Psilocybe cubensis]